MKFQLLLAALTGVALSQYQVGNTGGLNLPGTPSGTSDSTGGQVSTLNIPVPTFPAADLLKLNGGSTNTQVTNQNVFGTINGAKK